ncbi:hypothetical protein [Escherichia coli]|uniref:hypothetical protein n=1 Tax=Escherichia coli TaxID=562 RepID=UPI0010223B1B|nr:hypothetical protein [Escherichia coli]
MCSVGDLLPRSGGGMACQAAGKPWQAYACLKCRRAAPAALPFLPVGSRLPGGIRSSGPTPTGSCWRTRQSPPNPLARFRAAATVRCLKNQACSDRSGRAAPVAPETALPAHLTVCKATAPDGAVNPSAATPAACFPLWTFRGLE